MRYCRDIGLWAIDRPIPVSCVHATELCRASCYNLKFMAWPSTRAKDEVNELEWQNLDPRQVAAFLRSRRKPVKRVRLMTRGEAFKDHSDVGRVLGLLREMPDILWWIPTRAWRSPLLRLRIEQEVMPEPNAALLASLDESNTREEYESLVLSGWSTMGFSKDFDAFKSQFDWRDPKRCPKTYAGVKGACAVCNQCFSAPVRGKRVDVFLDQH